MSRPGSCKDVGRIAGLYDLEQTIGRGHFAVVRLARHVFTGERVAVKVIDKSRLDPESRSHLFQEVRCMKLVQHPNIVRLYEVIDTQSKLYLILELADGGDMYDYIMKHDTGLSESLGRKYFLQIVRAISYCHQLHVVHRDLKPENVVFFEKQGIVKLTDFGFSNRFLPGQKLETSCGSLAYSAPEILLGDSYDPTSVDVWSLGAVLYMLVCGYPPFQEVNDSETLTMIMDCKYRVPETMSQGCRSLIGRMLQRDPSRRATLPEIESDAWLTEGKLQLVTDDPAAADQTPLVVRQQLPEQDHLRILQKIVSGGLGTREQVVEALDRNDYNYITATYFLLAERRLRAMQDGRQSASASTTAGSTSLSVSAASGYRSPSPTVTDGHHASRLAAAMARPGKLVPSQLSASVSTSTVDQVCAGGAVGGESTSASSALSSASPPATPSKSQCQQQRLTPRRLHAVRSSPQLLEIHEEEEDESGGQRERQEDSCGDDNDEVVPPTTKLRSRLVTRTLASPGRLRRLAASAAPTAAPPSTPVAAAAGGGVRQRRRPGGSCSIPPTPASCSSSDASDDDEQQLVGDGQRRHHHQDQQHAQLVTPSSTPPRLSAMPRRDSHDDSSDSAAESGGVMGRLSRGVQRRLALRAARGSSGEGGSGGQGGSGGGGGQGGRSRYRARSACGRLASDGLPTGSVTASRSLNCISELHVLDLGYCSARISAAAAAQVCVSPDHVTTVRVGGPNVTVLSVRAGGVIGYPVSTAAAGDAPPFVWAVG